ncbi:hypothetical protein SAMN05444354_102192 [Stigmatella aurantiaca]|uniref:Uncharacterized protein n=1 Tax=Stigmatella aurantiaca TaxID=41 RepID=A0A1H7JIE0_STIAU|nr:hypothetical protein [Stigmatella aurantiaca]SEK73205.1 hypothetical protein SAMN05444354_102192 [Stigmatella aurantiaca]
MTFGAISVKHIQLRQRLAVHIGSNVLPDITILPPAGTDDELSFIRLVGWAYVLLQETGKVPLNFLKELPPMSSSDKLLPQVERLRTWTSHNLYFSKDHDLKILRGAQAWFKQYCGTGTPHSPVHWEACFNQLSGDVLAVLTGAISACDALDSEIDGPRLVESLQLRLNRNWEAFRFDAYVHKAMTQLGFQGIDVVSFRKRHLDSWRKLVATTEDFAIERLLTCRIESDVLALMADALPVNAQELLVNLGLKTPIDVAAAMLIIRQQRSSESLDLPSLLQAIFNDASERRKTELQVSNSTVSVGGALTQG